MNTPRLLPLIGVAVVGVLAINVLSGARTLPDMLSAAKAMAEGAAPIAKKPAKGAAKTPEAPAEEAAPALPPSAAIAAAPAAGAVCAPSATELAKSAGLSPAELQVLQSLTARRGQIDQREKDLDTQTQLMAAAEIKLDAKMKALTGLKAEIEALMGQADQKTQSEVDRLVVVYSKMKPALAAPVMTQLDDKVRVPIAAAMKPDKLSAILANMAPADAKKLTELLAHRFAPIQQLAQAASAPPAPAKDAAPPAKDAAKEKPAPKAKAPTVAAEPGDANVDDAPAKPAKAKAKPIKVAKRAAPKPKPVAPKAKAPVEEAKSSSGPHPYSEVKDQPAKAAVAPAAAPAKT